MYYVLHKMRDCPVILVIENVCILFYSFFILSAKIARATVPTPFTAFSEGLTTNAGNSIINIIQMS